VNSARSPFLLAGSQPFSIFLDQLQFLVCPINSPSFSSRHSLLLPHPPPHIPNTLQLHHPLFFSLGKFEVDDLFPPSQFDSERAPPPAGLAISIFFCLHHAGTDRFFLSATIVIFWIFCPAALFLVLARRLSVFLVVPKKPIFP